MSAEVLRELPKQVTDFFSRVGKKPNPPIQVNPNQYMQIQQGIGGGLLGMLGVKPGQQQKPQKQMIPQPNMNTIGANQPQVPSQVQANFQQGFAELLKNHNGQTPISVTIPPQPGDPNFVLPQSGKQQPPVNPGGAL